jgi:hypothetical protein
MAMALNANQQQFDDYMVNVLGIVQVDVRNAFGYKVLAQLMTSVRLLNLTSKMFVRSLGDRVDQFQIQRLA